MRRAPTFWTFFLPALLVAFLVYSRNPASNHIFDEQEALLANPYVAGDAGWLEVFRRDFWGLPPHRTIGSYRPLPNLVWRALSWPVLAPVGPWVLHLANLVGHAAVAATLASFAFAVSGVSLVGWMTGGAFLLTAVLTEAVTGVVGLADVLGGLGVALALQALRLPLVWMGLGVFAALCLGLGSKESVLAVVPLVAVAAFASAESLHRARALRWLRGLTALLAACAALFAYTEFRRHFFPTPLPPDLAEVVPATRGERLLHDFLVWFHQPKLPRDPQNNPLLEATLTERIAGALEVYAAGLLQVVFPWSLSGDYSFPQQTVPRLHWISGSLLGAVFLVAPVAAAGWLLQRRPVALVDAQTSNERQVQTTALPELLGPSLCLGAERRRAPSRQLKSAVQRPLAWIAAKSPMSGRCRRRPFRSRSVPHSFGDRAAEARSTQLETAVIGGRARPTRGTRSLVALGLLWVPLAYLPHSNLLVLLPTVRAERFWYLPALGSAMLVGVVAARLCRRRRAWAWALVAGFFAFQALQARAHALHYSDDLVFWRATKVSSPKSAKAHLNYAVMVGARGDLEARLAAGARAIDLAPDWGMAHVYQGDVLCRLGRLQEAWRHYERGFLLEPTAQNQIALALQCLWDRGAIESHRGRLLEIADKHPGTWLGYLARDIVQNGATHRGVDPRYRPRGYNQGPRSEGSEGHSG